MKYPPRRGRAAPIAVVRPPAAPQTQAGTAGPPRLTPQQAAMLPSGTRFVGVDGLPRIRR